MRFAFIAEIDEENAGKPRRSRIPVSLACEVLEVSRAGYYAWMKRDRSSRAVEDEELMAAVIEIDTEHEGRYGIDRIHRELERRGRRHSPKRVRRLARAAGLRCVHPRPYKATTVQAKTNPLGLVDLIDRAFVADGQDEVWYGDITYIHTITGWAYLATVIDGHSRKVVGWSIATHMRTELVTDALTMAIQQRRPAEGQVVFHSDRGSQYTSARFRDLCLSNGILPSVGKTGICFDNAAAESFNATLKKELIHLHVWSGLKKVRQAVFGYIETYYNRKRIQKNLGYLTPVEYECRVDKEILQAA